MVASLVLILITVATVAVVLDVAKVVILVAGTRWVRRALGVSVDLPTRRPDQEYGARIRKRGRLCLVMLDDGNSLRVVTSRSKLSYTIVASSLLSVRAGRLEGGWMRVTFVADDGYEKKVSFFTASRSDRLVQTAMIGTLNEYLDSR